MEQAVTKPASPLKGKPRKDPHYWRAAKDKRRKERDEKLGVMVSLESRSDKITLTAHDMEQIRSFAALHLSLEEIASLIGMSRETFRRCRAEDPRIDLAIELGKSQSQKNVTATAYRMATGGKSATMTQFWLETKGRWKKTLALELKRGVEELSEEELEQRLNDLRKLNERSNGEPY